MHWKDLIDRFACPACRSPLRLQPATATSAGPSAESLRCDACKRVYPVRDDIPILLIDQATITD